MTDRPGLARAAGEGIFPNTDVTEDPAYRQFSKEGKLSGNQWTFARYADAGIEFYVSGRRLRKILGSNNIIPLSCWNAQGIWKGR